MPMQRYGWSGLLAAFLLTALASAQTQVTINTATWSGNEVIVEAEISGSSTVEVLEIQFDVNPPAAINEEYGPPGHPTWQVPAPGGATKCRVKYKYNGTTYHTDWKTIAVPPE